MNVITLGQPQTEASRAQCFARLGISLTFTLALAGCGGASSMPGQSSAPTAVEAGYVTAWPDSLTMTSGESVDLSSMVQVFHSANTAVSWAVQEGASGGTISSAGVYTSPATFGTYHVVVTTQVNAVANATITIDVGPITVSVVPATDTLGPNGVRSFAARTSAIDQRVVWTVLEGAAGGSITDNRYTAPNSIGAFHVIATSAHDSTASASATITVVASGFRPANDMLMPRSAHTATVLQNGKVLIAGGGAFNTNCSTPWDDGPVPCPLADAELYDPATGAFSGTGTMLAPTSGQSATLLPNGKVLLAGSTDTVDNGSSDAELYDPATGQFAITGNLTEARFTPTAILLANGKVLVTGGIGNADFLATTELYDPQSETFTAGSAMSTPRTAHTATLLPDGRVLIAGGFSTAGTAVMSAELYDPVTALFTRSADMGTARAEHRATLLANGTVLITGGEGRYATLNTAEVFDPVSGRFSPTGTMVAARSAHIAVALASGKVLVSGGNCDPGDLYCSAAGTMSFTAELYDPTARSFTQTGSMAAGLVGPAAVVLGNGQVLVTGGSNFASAELYR